MKHGHMKHELYPPLSLLRSDLFDPPAAAPSDGDEAARDDAIAAAPAPDMPAFLQELVRRRVDAAAAHAPQAPAVGQIRRLDAVPGHDGARRAVGRSFGVLLGASLGGRRWSGWLVAQESAYASERDLVLQEDDGVADPLAAMVQAWNPVEVALRGDEAILARLPANLLGAVMRLGDESAAAGEFVAPRPGRIGAWDLDEQTTVVTGTPLGEDDDPRHAYRRLYRELAQEVSAAARAAPQATGARDVRSSWWERLQHTFVRPAWTFGALALVVAQGAWMLGAQDNGEQLYRGAHVPAAQACQTQLRLLFRPDAAYADVIVTLRRADATLVDGPSETGEVWIVPAGDQDPNELAGMLRQSRLVEQADVIEPDRRRCAR